MLNEKKLINTIEKDSEPKGLATLEIVTKVETHPSADRLDIVTVLGWNIITSRGLYKAGDIVIYIRPDTVVPNNRHFEFMEKYQFRVKPQKLRGIWSQGIICSTSLLNSPEDLYEGQDVTEEFGIKKYEKPVPVCISGDVIESFPSTLIPRTDEETLQNIPDILKDIKGKPYYITRKHDGTSATFIKHEETLKVCSRNWRLQPDNQNTLWKLAKKYELVYRIPEGIAIQAECIGEGIQKNKEKIQGQDIRVFNVWNIQEKRMFSYDEISVFCKARDLPMVELVEEGPSFSYETVEEMVDMAAKVRYSNGVKAEGIVVRLKNPKYNPLVGKDLSFKVINPEFASKE